MSRKSFVKNRDGSVPGCRSRARSRGRATRRGGRSAAPRRTARFMISPVMRLAGWAVTRRFTQITLSTRLETNPKSCETIKIVMRRFSSQDFQQAGLDHRVHVRRRFVQDQQVGLAAEGPGDQHAPAVGRRKAPRKAAAKNPPCPPAPTRQAACRSLSVCHPVRPARHRANRPSGPAAGCRPESSDGFRPEPSRPMSTRSMTLTGNWGSNWACCGMSRTRHTRGGRLAEDADLATRSVDRPRFSFTSVVFPPPLGPTMHTASRWPIDRLTSSSTGGPPSRSPRLAT